MQLTGDRFTSETAAFGNDLSTLPELPRRDPRARRHAARRVALPAALRRPRHHDAGRRAERPGRDEPGGAEGQPRRPAARRGPHRQHRRVHHAQPRQGRLRGQPARGRLARRLQRAPDAADLDDGRGAARASTSRKKDAERAKNMFALGLLSWLYHRPTEGDDRVPRAQVRRSPRSSRPTSRRSRPAGTSARPPRTSRSRYEVKPAPMPPGTYRNITGNLALSYGLVAASQRPGCRCSSAPTRSRRPRTSCTS